MKLVLDEKETQIYFKLKENVDKYDEALDSAFRYMKSLTSCGEDATQCTNTDCAGYKIFHQCPRHKIKIKALEQCSDIYPDCGCESNLDCITYQRNYICPRYKKNI